LDAIVLAVITGAIATIGVTLGIYRVGGRPAVERNVQGVVVLALAIVAASFILGVVAGSPGRLSRAAPVFLTVTALALGWRALRSPGQRGLFGALAIVGIGLAVVTLLVDIAPK
jgi:hypothetical protein